jgi:peptide/nickel transport system substrate-binding protein/oligopeptide transport system substrate-binding protein
MRLGNRKLALAGLLAVLATVLGLLSACGGSTSPTALSDDKQIMRINEKGPKQGDITQLDPQLLYYADEYQIAKEVFVSLLTLDANSKVVGDGAQSYDVSSDGLTYTFHIRDGIKWADGTAITSKDFADGIARSQDPCIRKGKPAFTNYYLGGAVNELLVGAQAEEASACPKDSSGNTLFGLTTSPIEGTGKAVDAVDAKTLVLRITKPAPYFLAALTYPTSDPVPASVLAAGGYTWSQKNLCVSPGFGSGPYKCTVWDHAGHLTLQRNDNYYGGKSKIREIDYVFYQDTETPYSDWKAGKGDISYPPSVDYPEASALAGFHSIPEVGVEYIQPNWNIPPFDNLDARIAFDAATDRTVLANVVLHGAVTPTINYIVQGLPGYNTSLQTSWGATGTAALKGDATQAKSHITAYATAKCGGDVTKCPPVEYEYGSGSPSALADAQALLQMWQTAMPGYPITIKAVDRDQLINNAPNYQMPAAGWIMDYPADQDWYDSLLEKAAGQNQTGINVPEADSLAGQANATVDATAAEALYKQAEQAYVNKVAWIVTDQLKDNYLVSKHLTGYAENSAALIATSVQLSMYLTA